MLCYYSTYFDRCFNGGFREAKEQKLVLPEDRIDYFQLLLDYVFISGGELIRAEGDGKQQMKYYMDFIEYAGKYDLIGAIQIISGALKDLIKASFRGTKVNLLLAPVHIEIIFRVLPEGHELRGLVAVLALKFGLVSGLYKSQEKTVDGFAAEILNQLRKHKTGRNFSIVENYYDVLEHTF
jgi:hypothetical protein